LDEDYLDVIVAHNEYAEQANMPRQTQATAMDVNSGAKTERTIGVGVLTFDIDGTSV